MGDQRDERLSRNGTYFTMCHKLPKWKPDPVRGILIKMGGLLDKPVTNLSQYKFYFYHFHPVFVDMNELSKSPQANLVNRSVVREQILDYQFSMDLIFCERLKYSASQTLAPIGIKAGR